MLKSGGSILDANPGSDLDAIQHHDCLYLLAAAKAVAAIRTMLGCRVPSFGIWPYGECGGTEK